MKAGQRVLYSDIILLQPNYKSLSSRGLLVNWFNKNVAYLVLISLLAMLMKIAGEALAEYLLHYK